MLRFCSLWHAGALIPRYERAARVAAPIAGMTTPVTGVGTFAALQFQQHRAYATGTRSTARERRHYTQPLRAPRYGISTVVGRQRNDISASTASGMSSNGSLSPMAEDIATGLGQKTDATHPSTRTREMTRYRLLKSKLVHFIASHGRPVRYNDAGVPIEGSLLLLPWREQLRLCTALLAAFCITKVLFDVVRFELLYYGLWKLSYRNDDSFMNRLLYYTSTAMLAAGLLLSFNLNFFLSACLVRRREFAAHMVCNIFAHVMPHRTLQTLASRIGIVIA
ncbi:hypothetical protein JKF63_05768 [Porcisia hertigi]|uniref:Uncharacterized protein n=1 Tax=Porcisia hertigi TaxID=2761500 RepID=A0A836LE15_9TRYP|nr:hypothetical protein JKF63_05768 [Porcisia hertigi]